MTLPDTKDWQRYEMELINCIKHDYPIIYKEYEGMSKALRSNKIRIAWESIGERFRNCPFQFHQSTWRNINTYFMNKYLRPKYRGPHVRTSEEMFLINQNVPKNKYIDGTLSFVEDEFKKNEKYRTQCELSLDRRDISAFNFDRNNVVQKSTKKYASLENEVRVVEYPKIQIPSISRQSPPQDKEPSIPIDTVDLDSDSSEEQLDETQENDDEDTGNIENDSVTSISRRRKTWTEEELLNATRLTRGMITELIRIKCRNTDADITVDLE